MSDLNEFVAIIDAGEVPQGKAAVATHNGRKFAVCHVDDEFHVVDDLCSHDDGPLGSGTLDGCAIICPRHGARFDVRTGAVLSMPAAFPIRAYESRVVDGKVEIRPKAKEMAKS